MLCVTWFVFKLETFVQSNGRGNNASRIKQKKKKKKMMAFFFFILIFLFIYLFIYLFLKHFLCINGTLNCEQSKSYQQVFKQL